MESNSPSDITEKAMSLFRQGQEEEAKTLLKDFISTMPLDWKPINISENTQDISFWDMNEFLSYVAYVQTDTAQIARTTNWIKPSYSKAYYYLAYIGVEQNNPSEALDWIEEALKLEPDHPLILSEKAIILQRSGDIKQAYDLYIQAAHVRSWATDSEKAKALRGAGCVLIDMNNLDDAEMVLRKSLELEPDSNNAIEELVYIQHLRDGGDTMESGLKDSDGSTFLSKLEDLYKNL